MDDNEPKVSIQAIGDIAFFLSIQTKFSDKGVNPFAPVQVTLNRADVLLADFEFPFSGETKPGLAESNDYYRARPESIRIMDGIKVDVCTLANNHILDWGPKGIQTTQELLAGMGVQTIGAGANCFEARRPVVVERNGIRLGILAYAKPGTYSCGENHPGAASLRAEDVFRDILTLKPHVNHVILLLHWGVEFCDYPYPDDVVLGRALIDAGASVIFGCHAHVIQGIERYQHGVIFYGLGNFVYDPFGERIFVEDKLNERRECIIAQVSLTHSRIDGFDFIPCRIRDDGCTEIMSDAQGKLLRQRVNEISSQIGHREAFYSSAAGNVLKRELRTYWYYLRRDKLGFVWRVIRGLKWRHIKILCMYFVSRLIRKSHTT